MAEPYGISESDPDPGSTSDLVQPPRAPLWVKVFGIATAVVLVLFVAVLLVGGGHGPSRHGGGDPTTSQPQPTAPAGGHG